MPDQVPDFIPAPPPQPQPSAAPDFIPAAPPQQSAAPTNTPPPPQDHWYDSAVSSLKNFGEGAVGESMQLPVTLVNAAERIPGGVGAAIQRYEQSNPENAAFRARAAQKPTSISGDIGAGVWDLAEFAAGEEALKGLSMTQRITKLMPTMKALEQSPGLQRIVRLARMGTVGTAQSLGHGQSLPQALESGAATTATGGAMEALTAGAGNILDRIRPSTADVLGEKLPVLASQEAGASPMAESIADIRGEPKVAAAQQKGAATAIVNRAQRVAATELHKLNAARAARWVEGEGVMNLAPEEAAGGAPELGTGQAALPEATATGAPQLEAGAPPSELARTNAVGPYEGEFPEEPQTGGTAQTPPTAAPAAPGQRIRYIEEHPPNFQPIDVNKEIQGIRSFGDAADKIRQHAGPVFDTFDKATGGEYTRLRAIRDAGYAAQDYTAVNKAERDIDSLFDWQSLRGKIDRTDYQAAKSAWRNSKLLDAVHDAVDRSFNVGDESLAQEAGVWRGINGGRLMNGVNRLTRDYGREPIENVIGKDGLTGLLKIADLTQTPQRAALYGQKTGDVLTSLAGGGRAGMIPSTIDWVRRFGLHQFATNPRAVNALDFAIKNNIPARIFAPLISSMMGTPPDLQPQGAQ